VAAAGRAYQQLAFRLLNLLQEFKQHNRTIPADTRSQLECPDHQRLKGWIFYGGKQVEHIAFAGFLGNGTGIPGFDTIVRASEIGMTDIRVVIVSPDGIGQDRSDTGRQRHPPKPFGILSGQTPFGGKVDGHGGYNPVRRLIG
jgi:hypothetical protein